jgi:hypothetical protein
MENRKLTLELKLRGDTETRVVGADRIRVDGRGRLLLYSTSGGAPENFWLREVQSFSIRRPSHLSVGAAG